MRNGRPQRGSQRQPRSSGPKRRGLGVTCTLGAMLVAGCARFGYELVPVEGSADTLGGSGAFSTLGASGAGVGGAAGGLGGTTGDAGTTGEGGSGFIDSGVIPELDSGATGAADSGSDADIVTPPVLPTCSDGLQNQDEIGTDCGGASCIPCPCALGAPLLLGNPNYTGNSIWSPSLSPDGLTMFISVNVAGTAEQLGVATRPDRGNTFGFADSLPAPVFNLVEGTPHLSSDGLRLYFYSTRAGGAGDRDIYVAARPSTGVDFNTVTPVGGINTAAREHLPWLSDDELSIYFSSTRAGGEDIFRSTRAALGNAFDLPVAVDELNSAGTDSGPMLSQDGRIALFASNRGGGVGDMDLYQAVRATPSDPFSAPINLGAPNSTAMDLDPELSRDGTELFFISRRNGSETALYRVTRSCP